MKIFVHTISKVACIILVFALSFSLNALPVYADAYEDQLQDE